MTPVITVEHLHKRYGDAVAVDDVSFTVEQGEIFGIVGPNGAGKTTTVESIEGLRVPDRGRIRVLGLDPQRDAAELHQRVGVQLQDSQLPDRLRVAEALELYCSFYRYPADWRELLAMLGLAGKTATAFRHLSGGERQRLSIALALVGSPEVAVLDELTTGLDPQARRDTWSLIEDVRDHGVTILLVTHFMEEAQRLCGRVAVIDSGRVVALDTPAALASGSGMEQRIRFRPSSPLDDRLITGLPEVTSIARHGDQVLVTGTGDVLSAVTAVLARHEIIARQLRVEQASLRRLATTPVGPARMLGAQLAVQASVTAVTVIMLLAVARIAYGVPLPGQPGGFLLAAVLAAAALYSLGLVIGAVVRSGRAAQPIGALVFFPMMFFAGLWLPIAAMPSML